MIYHTTEWRKTRAIVLDRDHHQCQLCGERATIADHHPLPVLACADPYNPDTCRALCQPCSGMVDGRRRTRGVGSRSRTGSAPKPLSSPPFTETRRGSGPQPLVA